MRVYVCVLEGFHTGVAMKDSLRIKVAYTFREGQQIRYKGRDHTILGANDKFLMVVDKTQRVFLIWVGDLPRLILEGKVSLVNTPTVPTVRPTGEGEGAER